MHYVNGVVTFCCLLAHYAPSFPRRLLKTGTLKLKLILKYFSEFTWVVG